MPKPEILFNKLGGSTFFTKEIPSNGYNVLTSALSIALITFDLYQQMYMVCNHSHIPYLRHAMLAEGIQCYSRKILLQ